ncbi:hypothetical protein [Streptomyces sp. V4I2]|uniref:hypothetical protein n=1 Tax=Streptomyces sp. V4I2 TaxID=3042280 RepID=UPI00278A26BC|nr:hypothetical protein [Streptomyces sp. V4I2]MDQ1047395.1 hypothetical protein [Streptomyces sp. V4I2]
MNTPPLPLLEGQPATTTGPQDAEQTSFGQAVGGLKVAACKGVPSALRTEKFRSDQARHSTLDPTPDRPGIRIYAPPLYRHHWDGARWSKRHGDTPNAAYACSCGQTGTATGAPNVAALATEYADHIAACTGAPAQLLEGSNAA